MPEAKQPAAPVRPFWSGTITFGLVSIPVDLFAAVVPRRKSMSLRVYCIRIRWAMASRWPSLSPTRMIIRISV